MSKCRCNVMQHCFHSATDDFNHGVVLSSRPLRSNEVFQVRIDKMVDKWAGSIEIGVTTHNPAYLQLPSTMTNLRSGNIRYSWLVDVFCWDTWYWILGVVFQGRGWWREMAWCTMGLQYWMSTDTTLTGSRWVIFVFNITQLSVSPCLFTHHPLPFSSSHNTSDL